MGRAVARTIRRLRSVPTIARMLSERRTLSFEFFPPKNAEEAERLESAIRDLESLDPSFVSVTYRGGRASRGPTTSVVLDILRTTTITPLPHLICVGHSRAELVEIVNHFRDAGVENLLALGGDPVEGASAELAYAIQLVELARAEGIQSIGVAAHPAGHPRSPDLESDRLRLAEKLRLADFAITQFFFRLDDYRRLLDQLQRLGVDKPVIPGVMPVLSLAGVTRMAELAGHPVPPDVVARLEPLADNPDALREAGIEIAVDLCARLLEAGAPGLHIYTLNRARAPRQIVEALGQAAFRGPVLGGR